jgi:hypothetical protein
VLLQIAFILAQLLERGSSLRRLAAGLGRSVGQLFGSLKNVARRLLEGIRYLAWEAAWFDPREAGKLRIGLDSSGALVSQVFSGFGGVFSRCWGGSPPGDSVRGTRRAPGRRRHRTAARPGADGSLRLRQRLASCSCGLPGTE